jgi:hypothetical protein
VSIETLEVLLHQREAVPQQGRRAKREDQDWWKILYEYDLAMYEERDFAYLSADLGAPARRRPSYWRRYFNRTIAALTGSAI